MQPSAGAEPGAELETCMKVSWQRWGVGLGWDRAFQPRWIADLSIHPCTTQSGILTGNNWQRTHQLTKPGCFWKKWGKWGTMGGMGWEMEGNGGGGDGGGNWKIAVMAHGMWVVKGCGIKRDDVTTAILYFRFQDRWTEKKR